MQLGAFAFDCMLGNSANRHDGIMQHASKDKGVLWEKLFLFKLHFKKVSTTDKLQTLVMMNRSEAKLVD
jgi:hypothetical protein